MEGQCVPVGRRHAFHGGAERVTANAKEPDRQADGSGGFEKVSLQGLEAELGLYKDEAGFEFIAGVLGIPRPLRITEQGASRE